MKQVYKVVILGDPEVGKSSISNRIIEKGFSSNYLPTMAADLAVVKRNLDNGDRLELHFWDIAGQEQFKRVTPRFVSDSNGAIFVYDLANKRSFLSLVSWVELLKENNMDNFAQIPVLLVGNKHDLPDHAIQAIDVADFVGKLSGEFGFPEDNIDLFQTSALTGENIDMIIEHFLNKLL